MGAPSCRIIQWATGSVGQIAIRHIVETDGLDLVGAYVTSEGKVGHDAGALAGIDPVGVAASGDVDDVLAIDADCVVYAPLHADLSEHPSAPMMFDGLGFGRDPSGYWGRVWTAMNTVNAIPAVCGAAPGIRTHLDLPFVRPLNLVRPASRPSVATPAAAG
jgi:hypothetical protein